MAIESLRRWTPPAPAAIATSSALVAESILLFFVTKRRLGIHMFVFGRRAGS